MAWVHQAHAQERQWSCDREAPDRGAQRAPNQRGEVWKCENSKGEIGAIKLIKTLKSKSYDRFLDEIKVIEDNSDIEGIIPIIDKNLPKKLEKTDIPFFVMPVAISAEKELNGKTIEEKVEDKPQLRTNELIKCKKCNKYETPKTLLYSHKKHVPVKKELTNQFPKQKPSLNKKNCKILKKCQLSNYHSKQ